MPLGSHISSGPKLVFDRSQLEMNLLRLLPQKGVLVPKTIFHGWRFSVFDRLVFAFYWVDSIENCGVFFSYAKESKLNACDFFVIFYVVLSVDYDL